MAPAHIPLAAGKLFLVMADTPAMHRQRSSRQRRHSSPNQAVDQALRRRIELESLVVAISTRMLAALPETADAEIVAALGEMGSFSGAERSFLNQIAGDPPLASNTHEYCRGQLTSLREVVQGIPLSNYPWSFDQLQHGKAVWIHRDNMPPEAAAELQWLQRFDLASSLVVPLMVQGRLAGALGFNTKSREKGWGDEDLDCLRMAGEIFLQALARQRAELEQQKLKDQLLRMARMESIGRLAGGVAHDFNNLLAVISGYSESMLRRTGNDHPLRGHIEEIYRAASRGAALTQQLLAFSRRQRVPHQPMDLSQAVQNVYAMLRRVITDKIDIQISAPDPVPIVADPGQIEQVLVNLAINARDAMPQGGRLLISTETINEAAALTPLPAGRYGCLSVSDSGMGMDVRTSSRIFEPFFTTKGAGGQGGGTGLGLNIVFGIVQQAGGTINVQSAVGQGTRFIVYFPSLGG
jgi:signal transduction histidine kinase